MARPPKPTFITELPLVTSLAQDAVMQGRFEAGRRLFNAVLGDALKALDLMRQSRQWQAARALPKGEPKSSERKARAAAFKACNEHFGFTEYGLQAVATGHKNAAAFTDRLGAHETQKIGTRAFAAVQEHAFGQRGRPRFKGKHRPLHSLEGKSNAAGPRWHADTATVSWGKGFVIPAKMPSKTQDPYLHACLQAKTKYCRITWRMQQGKRRWFVQLVQNGVAPAKYDFLASGQVVGLDIGPSTVAVVGDDALGLEQLAPSVGQPWTAMRALQRAQDRSRRATNPDRFNADGTAKAKRGHNGGVNKGWARSSRYRTRQARLQDIERKLAEARKRDHGHLANKILGLGNVIQTEKLSCKAWQKSFGRSAKVRAAGMFVSLLIRKAESAGGQVVELNTQKLRMSQYDHTTGVCTKKPLSQRWHALGEPGEGKLQVQRDCYSAWLAKCVRDNQHKPSQLEESWAAAQPLLRRAGLCVEQFWSGGRLRSPTVAFKPLPSDGIARQRRFVRGHAGDAVAARREPRNPTQSAFRTPGL
jgi:hypothetical protein